MSLFDISNLFYDEITNDNPQWSSKDFINKIKEQKRLERIENLRLENVWARKSDLEQSVVYCTAYVDGEIAIEERIKSMQHEKKEIDAARSYKAFTRTFSF